MIPMSQHQLTPPSPTQKRRLANLVARIAGRALVEWDEWFERGNLRRSPLRRSLPALALANPLLEDGRRAQDAMDLEALLETDGEARTLEAIATFREALSANARKGEQYKAARIVAALSGAGGQAAAWAEQALKGVVQPEEWDYIAQMAGELAQLAASVPVAASVPEAPVRKSPCLGKATSWAEGEAGLALERAAWEGKYDLVAEIAESLARPPAPTEEWLHQAEMLLIRVQTIDGKAFAMIVKTLLGAGFPAELELESWAEMALVETVWREDWDLFAAIAAALSQRVSANTLGEALSLATESRPRVLKRAVMAANLQAGGGKSLFSLRRIVESPYKGKNVFRMGRIAAALQKAGVPTGNWTGEWTDYALQYLTKMMWVGAMYPVAHVSQLLLEGGIICLWPAPPDLQFSLHTQADKAKAMRQAWDALEHDKVKTPGEDGAAQGRASRAPSKRSRSLTKTEAGVRHG